MTDDFTPMTFFDSEKGAGRFGCILAPIRRKRVSQQHVIELNIHLNTYDDGKITYQVIDGFDEYTEAGTIEQAVKNALDERGRK